MSRILFYSEAWGQGGIEAFIRNIAPSLVSNGHEIDIFSTWEWKGIEEPDLDRLGIQRSSVFHGCRPNQAKRLFSGVRAFEKKIKVGRYDTVWINTMNGMGFLYARAAQRFGVPNRVVHSHNSDVGSGMRVIKRFVGRVGSILLRQYSTCNLACSKAAGEYLFGGEHFEIVPNGVDIKRFTFSRESRKHVREELGVCDSEVLIGNIGRINFQKNPLFQVRVFAEYLKINPMAKYLMLGKSDMEQEVYQLARDLNIADNMIILNPVSNAAPYYSALDALLMPSLFEGLSFSKIEAQCAGLPIVCSDNMSAESDITDLVHRCNLNDSAQSWANKLSDAISSGNSLRDEMYAQIVSDSGYSLQSCIDFVLQVLNAGI